MPRCRVTVVDANDGIVALGAETRQILRASVTEEAPDRDACRRRVGNDHRDRLTSERVVGR